MIEVAANDAPWRRAGKGVSGVGRLGPTELLIILGILLLIIGPKKLPELGRSLGGAIREFRKGGRASEDDDDRDGREGKG